jgi:hypothetical protein
VSDWAWGDKVAPPEETVRICVRGDLVADKEWAEKLLVASRSKNPTPEIGDPEAVQQARLAQEIQRLEEECERASVTFRFRGLSRRDHSDLLAAHPPTEEQQKELAELGLAASANSETFPPALVAASCIEPPGVTLETATEAFEQWPGGTWSVLWRACMAANQGSSDPGPKSAIASAVLRDSAAN